MNKSNQIILGNIYTDRCFQYEVMATYPGGVTLKRLSDNQYASGDSSTYVSVDSSTFSRIYRKVRTSNE